MRKELIIRIVVLVIGVGVGYLGWRYLQVNPTALAQVLGALDLQQVEEENGRLSASGFIEASEVAVVPEVGGTITRLYVDEGDVVRARQLMAKLDTALIEAQIAQAEAAVEVAQATLAQVKAGMPPTKIARAEAEVAQAQAQRDAAEQTWRDAQRIRDNPQQLNARINAARYKLQVAELQVQQMEALAVASDLAYQMFGRSYDDAVEGISYRFVHPFTGKVMKFHFDTPPQYIDEINFQWGSATSQAWESWEAYEQMKTMRDGARRTLDKLINMRDNPVEANAAVNAAKVQLEVAAAAVAAAEARLAAMKAGAAVEQIAIAESTVAQAEAALAPLQVELAKRKLRAPHGGTVVERLVHEGELTVPGAPLLQLADLDSVELTIYIPEDKIGLVKLGQAVEVTVDSYEGRVFKGKVVYISPRAEFTPKNVQTQEERVNTVFGVKVQIPNEDHALKAGMPADAVIIRVVAK